MASSARLGGGFIANTDLGWSSHLLHRAEPSDEVDFWQPSPHGLMGIPPGAPIFFRLGAPHRATSGFAFFARYERVPAKPDWESLGDKYGMDTFAERAARIEAICRRVGSALLARIEGNEVGRIMISQAVVSVGRASFLDSKAAWCGCVDEVIVCQRLRAS